MRLPLLSVPLGALLAACTAIHTVKPADLGLPSALTRVWVTRADHTTVVFEFAQVRADSLIGYVDAQPQSLQLSKATVLRVREASPDRTAALVFAGVSGAVLVWILSKQGQPACGLFCLDNTK